MEDKAIYADLFVARNANPLYQLLFVAYRRERRHEPTVAVIALSHIIRGRAFYKELGVFEDVL
jgi:hypothetical protein